MMISSEKNAATLVSIADANVLSRASELLRQGELLIIPTETIPGLTCDATNSDAVDRLFEVKSRSITKVSAIYLSSVEAIKEFAHFDHDYVLPLCQRFLPGPLTIILRSKISKWAGIVSDFDKIGIRVSSHPFVSELVTRIGKPLIATSANVSGEFSGYDRDELLTQFGDSVPLILYGDEVSSARASTVVDLTERLPRLLREGGIPFEEILTLAGEIS